MSSPTLILVRETWSHMASVSGFDPLFGALEKQGQNTQDVFVPRVNTPGLAGQVAGKLNRLWSAPVKAPAPSPFVEARHERLGNEVLVQAKQNPDALVMLSAAENQYSGVLAAAPQSVKSRLVLFLHQPPSWHRLHWRDPAALRGVGALVSLCDEQAAYLKTQTDAPVLKIAHGVDSEFFAPGAAISSNKSRLLFVGQWLRDFETLYKSMEVIWASHPEVELDCVVPMDARVHPAMLQLARNPRVRWHAGLSVERLKELYQQATLLFLPVIDSTANNAVVEAMASGLPVVSTNVGGMPDYVSESCGILCPAGNARNHAAAALAMLSEPDDLFQLRRKACRTYAEVTLNWNRIAEGLMTSLKK